jgi:chemosensory pili system protein ChpA (sensor histidine kinase/response regulator)
MAERHDPNQLVGAAPDVAPLAWVIDEIRTSLGEAVGGLKAFVANKQDVDSIRNARNQVHQANGALQLLDLRGVALVTEAVEQLTRQFEADPKECLPAPVRVVETALSAVMAYLEGLLSGRPNQPLRLFPYYRDVLQLIGAARVHPADLVFPDLSRRPAFHQIDVRQFTPAQLRDRRARFELGLLGFLRKADDPSPRKAMRQALAELEHMPQRGLARSFWWVARGLLEALERNAIAVDVDLKRVMARLNLQLRRMIEGGGAVAERLMIDALYYVGRADSGIPRVAEVKRLYGLDALIPPDFETATLTALDSDALRNLKEALTQAKQLWGQIVAGAPETAKFDKEIALARTSANKLRARPLVAAVEAIGRATSGFAKLEPSTRDALGLEVASALLFVDLGVEELPQIGDEYEGRAQQVMERLVKARTGQPLPDAGPWMSDLARRAQDRLTMGTVVAETQATLREIEQRLDRFFRDPAQRADLPATTAMFDQVCGVLSLLGYDEPVAALRNVQESITRFADAAVAPEPVEFGRIAQNLGAIGFFVESVGQDADRPRGMFHYDPSTGVFSADIGQLQASEVVNAPADDELSSAPRTIDMRLPEPRRTDNVETAVRKTLDAAHLHAQRLMAVAGDARAIGELERLLPILSNEADLLDDSTLKAKTARAMQLVADLKEAHDLEHASELEQLLAPPKAPEAPPPTAPLPSSEAAANSELCGIFVEEAGEVLDSIVEHVAALRERPDDQATMTTVRRAFHTLKGSSRMVGFKTIGEGAWGVEQCFNLWLAQERPATVDLIDLAEGAERVIRQWVDAISVQPDAALDSAALVHAAQRVREGGAFEYGADLPQGTARPKDEGIPTPPASEMLTDAADAVGNEAPPSISLEEVEPEGAEVAAAEDDAFTAVEAPAGGFEFELPAAEPASVAESPFPDLPAADEPVAVSDDVKRIGPLEISHGLYSIFLSEADECIRVLANEVAEWRYEPNRTVSTAAVRRAHSLCGISRTVGLAPVVAVTNPLEDLMRTLSGLAGPQHLALSAAQFDTLERVVERVRGMMHQFAAGIYPDEAPLEAGAIQDLVAVVRAHSALHEDATVLEFVEGSDAPEDAAAIPADEPTSIGGEATEPAAAFVAEEIVAPLPAEPSDQDAGAVQSVAAVTPADQGAALDDQARDADEPADEGGRPAQAKVRDELDAELLEVFLTEAAELLPPVAMNLRSLAGNPNDRELAREMMRRLHTIKGSARMAGAMRLGELVHAMETRMEEAMQLDIVPSAIVDELHAQYDEAMALYDELQHPDAVRRSQEAAAALELPRAPVIDLAAAREHTQTEQRAARPESPQEPPAHVARPTPEVKRVAPSMPLPAEVSATLSAAAPGTAPQSTFIRVRADVLDKLVDQAGEVAIARSKLENEVGTIKGSLGDLTENISRLRAQLREVEIQADAQIQARGDKLSRDSADFDPLEFDRYTRLQELTRMLAESVEDMAMVQSNMLKGLQSADADLTSQSRLTRDLQQQLMRVRLVPFSNISERLYRVARQSSKELDKRVNLDLRGAGTELDRGVLEKMAGPFEHLIRNAIVHGLETPAERRAAGKAETGELVVDVKPEGNEIIIVISDDGAGLNLERIRERAIERDLIAPDQALSDRELMELIFQPGFTTANEVTELAGRGVGMDVVRAELASFGGRVAISSETGRGTRFTLYLPMTLAVAQVVLAKIGARRYAIPAGMVEQVRRYRPATLLSALAEGMIDITPVGQVVLRPLTQLVGEETTPHLSKQTPVILLRSGDDHLAVSVDDVSSNQEVVVKSVGAQVARLAGILGATILGNGEIVLIVNPVQLITRAPEPPAVFDVAPEARAEANDAQSHMQQATELSTQVVPTIMVVDDSLTVRRVTQRLLERQGYNVLLAKDGVDALRQLQDVQPDVMLVDIEMPRMDGYDLTRNVRGTRVTADIPIIMITSRTAEKHRSMAFELGVNEYLGKPYQEDELLRLLKQYLAEKATSAV